MRLARGTSPAMQRGKDIHTEVEHYLLTGEIRDSKYVGLNYRRYLEATIPHLPPPMHDELIVEQEILLSTGDEMPLWLGFIDIGYSGADPLQIRDLKTTSDFRYAKTPDELSKNIQLISYAKWAYVVAGHKGPIDLGHIYLKTEKKKVPKKPRTKPVNIIVEQAHVEDVWDSEMETVRAMQKAALVSSAHDLEPTISACSMYGGCPFSKECGLDLGSLFQLGNKKKDNKMGNKFIEELKKKREAAKAAAESGDAGVLPPDSPSRETPKPESLGLAPESTTDGPSDETLDAEAAKEAEKAAKKKAAAEKRKATRERKKAEKAAKEAEEKAAAEATKADSEPEAPKTNGKSFTLYIDCMPAKDIHNDGVAPTMFTDWYSSLEMSMNETVAEEKNLPHYMLLPFAENKALISLALAEGVKDLPSEMVMTSGTTGQKDALVALIPHATKVIRRL